jgi:hypothetical protein
MPQFLAVFLENAESFALAEVGRRNAAVQEQQVIPLFIS